MYYERYKSPVQTLGRVVDSAILFNLLYGTRYKNKPGEFFNSLPTETKEMLSKLKSSDLQNSINPFVYHENSDNSTRVLRRQRK